MTRVPSRVGRREFLKLTGRGGAGLVLAGSVPSLLAACRREVAPPPFSPAGYKRRTLAIQDEAEPLVGDIVDFALTSEDWEGVFGFVRLRMHQGVFEGRDLYFVRTDASDAAFARSEQLVFVPKLAQLDSSDLAGSVFLFDGAPDQPPIFSSEPGRDDFSPAWRVHRVSWQRSPRPLGSVADVESASAAGELSVEVTGTVLNAAVVKWSEGELAVDGALTEYLGGGQLIEPPDTSAMTVTFKLHECFPNTRYIVTDHSITMAAEMTQTVFAPGLQGGPTGAGATGRTNVFMNGLEGPGPMGFQPSAFDFAAADPEWSPYWDHWTYAWREGVTPSLLRTETAIHAARDGGDLEEFPGVPDTQGEVFTVNCPGPILAPNVFGE